MTISGFFALLGPVFPSNIRSFPNCLTSPGVEARKQPVCAPRRQAGRRPLPSRRPRSHRTAAPARSHRLLGTLRPATWRSLSPFLTLEVGLSLHVPLGPAWVFPVWGHYLVWIFLLPYPRTENVSARREFSVEMKCQEGRKKRKSNG